MGAVTVVDKGDSTIADSRIYGFMGFTHGWAKVLTITSRRGGDWALERLGACDGVWVLAGDGALPRLMEKRGGALRQIIEEHDIEVLERDRWQALKAELAKAPS